MKKVIILALTFMVLAAVLIATGHASVSGNLEKIRTITGVVGNILQALTLLVSLGGLYLLLHFHGVL